MRRALSAPSRTAAVSRLEDGFTLIELLVVLVLVGITTAMFETTMSTVVDRSSAVQSQNIIQTEVRSSLNLLVSDLRDATPPDTTTNAIADGYSATSITFYSPDSQSPPHMRRITYWVPAGGSTLMRQVAFSTNTDGPPWTFGTATTQILFGSIRNPTTIFRYCRQAPSDLEIDPTSSTSAALITWKCTTPASALLIKTVVIRAVVSALTTSTQYNYGAVATLRWNAS